MRQQKFDKIQILILFSLKADYRAQVLSLQFLKPPCFITEKKILSDPVDLQNKNFFKNMCEKNLISKRKALFSWSQTSIFGLHNAIMENNVIS